MPDWLKSTLALLSGLILLVVGTGVAWFLWLLWNLYGPLHN